MPFGAPHCDATSISKGWALALIEWAVSQELDLRVVISSIAPGQLVWDAHLDDQRFSWPIDGQSVSRALTS